MFQYNFSCFSFSAVNYKLSISFFNKTLKTGNYLCFENSDIQYNCLLHNDSQANAKRTEEQLKLKPMSFKNNSKFLTIDSGPNNAFSICMVFKRKN